MINKKRGHKDKRACPQSLESVRKEYGICATTKTKSYTITLDTLLRTVADWYGINMKSFPILGNDRRASQIRSVLAYLARSSGDISLKEVAKVCGRADNSMSQAASGLEVRMLKSGQLKKEIDDLRTKLILEAMNLSVTPSWKCEA